MQQINQDRDGTLLIVQVDVPQNETTGDFYYRAAAPGLGMAQCEGVQVVNLTNIHRYRFEAIVEADVLVLNNICDADLLPLIRDRKARGQITVYELCDDMEALPPSNPLKAFYDLPENMLLMKRLAHYCDALQFCSPALREKMGYLNSNCAVFPNHMLEIPPERPRKPGDALIVGWGGSLGHLKDMEQVSARLVHWVLSRPNVNLHLMCDESIWRLFAPLPEERKKRFAPGPLESYYRFVSQLDIGIAPLEDTPFNRSRSDVKFIEYAAHGVVPVVQAVGPYLLNVQHEKTGFLFHSTDELISTLDRLAASPDLVVNVSESARAYVFRERRQLDRGCDRVDFYLSLLSGRNAGRPEGRGRAELLSRMASKENACGPTGRNRTEYFTRMASNECTCGPAGRDRSKHLLLRSTAYEDLLQAGLHAYDAQNPGRSLGFFREAMQLEPDLYEPYLFGAFLSEDPVGMLLEAIKRNPRSIVSRIHLGKAYGARGMRTEAVESFKAAAGVFTEYERPYIECANFLNEAGFQQEGISILKKALELIPKVIRGPAK